MINELTPILCIAGGAAVIVFALLFRASPKQDLEGDGEYSLTYRGRVVLFGRASEIVCERCPVVSDATGEVLAERVTIYLLAETADHEQNDSSADGD